MKEYLLTTNEYLEPKIVKGSEAYGILLIRLLLLMPGTDPRHPGMGVGLPKYRFITDDFMPELQSIVQEQVDTYLPSEFSNTTRVYLELNQNKFLQIIVIADDTKYVFDTEGSVSPVSLSSMIL